MHLIRGIHNLPKLKQNPDIQANGSVITIGNFDGVHLGHQAILQKLHQAAKQIGAVSCVMIFEPQPLEFFNPQNPPHRISSLRDKLTQIKDFQVDYCICIKFNRDFANLSAVNFVQNILLNQLNVKHLIVGDDFHFGKNRHGNFAFLQQQGQIHNFGVDITPEVKIVDMRVSSTQIRNYLQRSDLVNVQQLLGRAFSVTGRVIHGNKLARTLGFPTANLSLLGRKLPFNGVFVVNAIIDDIRHQAIANVGFRPTVSSDDKQHLEVHIINFDADLYGKNIKIEFKEKIRDEQKFDNLEALKQAINQDVLKALTKLTQLKQIL